MFAFLSLGQVSAVSAREYAELYPRSNCLSSEDSIVAQAQGGELSLYQSQFIHFTTYELAYGEEYNNLSADNRNELLREMAYNHFVLTQAREAPDFSADFEETKSHYYLEAYFEHLLEQETGQADYLKKRQELLEHAEVAIDSKTLDTVVALYVQAIERSEGGAAELDFEIPEELAGEVIATYCGDSKVTVQKLFEAYEAGKYFESNFRLVGVNSVKRFVDLLIEESLFVTEAKRQLQGVAGVEEQLTFLKNRFEVDRYKTVLVEKKLKLLVTDENNLVDFILQGDEALSNDEKGAERALELYRENPEHYEQKFYNDQFADIAAALVDDFLRKEQFVFYDENIPTEVAGDIVDCIESEQSLTLQKAK